MEFLEPLYPFVGEAQEYIDGSLQHRRWTSLEVRLGPVRFTSWRQLELVKHRVEKPEVTMLSNDDMQGCISGIHTSLEADKLFHVAFRNVQGGCEPFIMSAPVGGHFSEKQLKAIMAAAMASAKMGLMLEFCEDVVTRNPELHCIYEECRHLGLVVAVPFYEFNRENKRELHGVMVEIRKHVFPITESAWGRIFHYCISDGMYALRVARSLGKLPHYDPQPLATRSDGMQWGVDWMKGWDKGVRVLTRERFVEFMEGLKAAGSETCGAFLGKAIDCMGFADPYAFHPKRLYKKLQATHDKEAVALTEATQKSATELTTSAISQSWLDTLRNVLGSVTTVIPDAEKTFFVTFEYWSKYKVSHNLPEELSGEEARAIGLVAQWAGFFGEAIFDTAADNRCVFNHLRSLTKCDVSIAAIPVYSWEVDKSEAPTLHGVFVALRHPSAPVPTRSTQMAWTLAAQYLLSPLAAKHDQKAAAYSTTNIVDSYRWACAQPPSPDAHTYSPPPPFFEY